MTKECIFCNSNKLEFIDKYKYEIESDNKYLGNMEIFKCNDCNFAFTIPMPEIKLLDIFYKNIYRNINRPHYYSKNYKKYSYLFDINLEYLSYLTSSINFNKINSIFDFGAGLGNLGYALKKKYKHLNLFCLESDENCKDILNQRGYKNFKNFDEIDMKFDLVISLHVFEHLTDLNVIRNLLNYIDVNGYLFFEVPNCDFEKGYKKRIFDSPHLIFFNKSNINNFFDKTNLSKISLINASYSVEHDIENQLLSKNKHNKKSLLSKLYLLIRKFIPTFVKYLRMRYKNDLSDQKLKWYYNNNENSRCIRGLYKKF